MAAERPEVEDLTSAHQRPGSASSANQRAEAEDMTSPSAPEAAVPPIEVGLNILQKKGDKKKAFVQMIAEKVGQFLFRKLFSADNSYFLNF